LARKVPSAPKRATVLLASTSTIILTRADPFADCARRVDQDHADLQLDLEGARLEYDYLGLSSRTFNGDGVIFPVNDTFDSGNRNVQMATFGINYRFGWGDPIAASY
jgi:hypothetical protein